MRPHGFLLHYPQNEKPKIPLLVTLDLEAVQAVSMGWEGPESAVIVMKNGTQWHVQEPYFTVLKLWEHPDYDPTREQ